MLHFVVSYGQTRKDNSLQYHSSLKMVARDVGNKNSPSREGFVTSSLELFEFISLSILDHQVVAEIKIFRDYAIFSSTVF